MKNNNAEKKTKNKPNLRNWFTTAYEKLQHGFLKLYNPRTKDLKGIWVLHLFSEDWLRRKQVLLLACSER